jgi:hypothetical protein
MGKFLLIMAIIFLGIYFIALITPKLAAFIDKRSGKAPAAGDKESPERVQEENYTVHDIYEGTVSKDNEKAPSYDKDKDI